MDIIIHFTNIYSDICNTTTTTTIMSSWIRLFIQEKKIYIRIVKSNFFVVFTISYSWCIWTLFWVQSHQVQFSTIYMLFFFFRYYYFLSSFFLNEHTNLWSFHPFTTWNNVGPIIFLPQKLRLIYRQMCHLYKFFMFILEKSEKK